MKLTALLLATATARAGGDPAPWTSAVDDDRWDGRAAGDIEGEQCRWVPIEYPAPFGVPPYKQCLHMHGELVSNAIKRSKRWPDCDRLVELWRETTGPGLFVDAGANIGSCSLALLSVGARTVAFEPVPANLHKVKSSVLGNEGFSSRFTLYPLALGDAPGVVEVFSQVANRGNSMVGMRVGDNAAQQRAADRPGSKSFDSARVRVARLDDVLWPEGAPPPPPIRLLKMDVQGFEPRVLAGASRLLEAGLVKIVRFEVSRLHLTKQTGHEMVKIMHDFRELFDGYGYAPCSIERPGPEMICRLRETGGGSSP